MRIAALIPLLGCIWNLVLAVFVLTRAPKAQQNRIYFCLGVAISIWNLGQFIIFTTAQAADGLFGVRFVWVGVIFIPMLLFHLSMVLTNTQVPGKLIPILYGVLGVLAATIPTEFFIRDVRFLGRAGWYAIPGPGLHLAMQGFVLMFVAIFILVRKRRALPRMYRSRLTALIVAQTMLATLGTNDTLPLIGFDFYPGTSTPVYPYGSIAAVFYGVIVAYTVLQHHLLDIQVGLSRNAAQIIRIIFLTVVTVALLMVATLIFPEQFKNAAFWIALSIFMISICAGSLIFPKLFGGASIEKLERRILGDHFEYQDRVRAFTDTVVWQNDLDTLFSQLHTLFVGAFKFDRYWMILRDKLDRAFVLARAHPDQPRTIIPELKVPSPVFDYFANPENEVLNIAAYRSWRSIDGVENAARDQLSRFPAEIALPLRWEGELFGLILIGAKSDEEPMTMTDLRLLIELTRRLSLVLNQIWLKEEIFRTQELELLGRMSSGMAHDLNNLLTPIGTLLQLANEGSTREAMDEQLVAIALQNVKAVNAYINEALFFSQNLRPDFELGRLDALVHQAVELAVINRRREVEVVAEASEEIRVEMDAVLIQRLLGNLISNAIDASPLGSTIAVELSRVDKTEARRDWLRLRVIDRGEGIPEENLKQVAAPYFTTKNRGDSRGGFGLGLAISQKIVALHGGTLTLSSRLQLGTTVQIDLPSRQNKSVIPSVAHSS